MAFKVMKQLSKILSGRLRTTNEKVKEGILWGLDISGASALSIQHLITTGADVEVELYSGRILTGKILLVVSTDLGYQMTFKEKGGRMFIIPYNALNYISLSEDEFGRTTKEQ